MKKLTSFLWLIPVIGLVYMYANQGIGVVLGSSEHYDLLAAVGLSGSITTILTWVSVVVDLGTAFLLVLKPSKAAFLFAGVWTWVPRVITLIYGGVENEVFESLTVSVLALLAYLAYRNGHYVKLPKNVARA